MSNSNKDLYDYDLVKKCLKCGNISLKSNFHKNKNRKDGLQAYCLCCRTQYCNENRDQIIEYKKKYYLDNRDQIIENRKNYIKQNRTKINSNERKRRQSDINYRLIKNTRCRIYHALNGKSKSSSTKDILGMDIDLYRKWLEFQFTPEMNWSNIEIDHVKPICMFDVSNDEQLKEAFSWKNTQPLLKQDHKLKGTKFNFLDYQLQFIKAYQFLKINEERFNENVRR